MRCANRWRSSSTLSRRISPIWIFNGLTLDIHDLGSIFEAEGIVGLGADRAQKRNRIANCFGIAIAKLDPLTCAFAACLHTCLSAPDHDDVIQHHEALPAKRRQAGKKDPERVKEVALALEA